MAQVLEWIQCRSCGRRHRWRADIAGTQIVCACGKMVDVPELQAFSQSQAEGPGQSLDDTMTESGALGSRSPVLEARDAELPVRGDIDFQLEGARPAVVTRGTKVRGLLGMGATAEFIFWGVMAAIGFTAIVFAAIVVEWYYIVLAVVWGPISFWKLRKSQRRWQGNRSFSKAFEETIGA